MADLLNALCAKLGTDLDYQGRAHADCPFCGAEGRSRSGGAKFHFYLFDRGGRRGAVCWSCGWGTKGYTPPADWRGPRPGTLAALAYALEVQGVDTIAPRAAPERPALPWDRPDALERYTAAMAERSAEVIAAWQSYKPLSAATIRRAGFGLGQVPMYDERRRHWYQMRFPRLLAPLVENGRMVGIAGRAYLPEDDGPKWLTASYSTLILHGLEQVRPGDVVIWVENRVDRLLVEEHEPGVKALASGGLTWQPAWLDALAARRPRHVLIWFDHDLSGNGSPWHEAELLARWRAKTDERRHNNPRLMSQPYPAPPQPRGPMLANELLERGIKASLYKWPRGSAFGADVGSAIIAERSAKRAA